MQVSQSGYFRHRAGSMTGFPFSNSLVIMLTVSPCHEGSAFTPNRLRACNASWEPPQPDSSAASAIVKLAGILVLAMLARAAGPIAAMKSSGFMRPPFADALRAPLRTVLLGAPPAAQPESVKRHRD